MREVTPVSAHCDLNFVQGLVVKAKAVSSISSTAEVIFISQSFADRLLILREYWFIEIPCLQRTSLLRPMVQQGAQTDAWLKCMGELKTISQWQQLAASHTGAD